MTLMTQESASESALIVTVPAAEAAIAPYRAVFDAAARLGVPAHLTLLYPFRPVEVLTAHDVRLLENLFGGTPPYDLVLARTAWFGDEVLYLAPEDPGRYVGLTRMVVDAFPDYPPYGGAYEQVVPHVTIGQGDVVELRAAEDDVRRSLPIGQRVASVELWSGPPLETGRGPWRRVSAFPLGG